MPQMFDLQSWGKGFRALGGSVYSRVAGVPGGDWRTARGEEGGLGSGGCGGTFGQELVGMGPPCMGGGRRRAVGDGLVKCKWCCSCEKGSNRGGQCFLKTRVSSLMVPLWLLSTLPCGHPPCFLPVEMKISFLSLGKASCQTPHQTLDRNRVLHHSSRVSRVNSAFPKPVGRSPATFPCL